jgi:hypothetical protein
MDVELKKCPKCGEHKSMDMFYRDRSRLDGVGYRCKECTRRYNAESHKEKISAYSKAYRDAHKEELAAKRIEAYHGDPKKYRERNRIYQSNNKESNRNYRKAYKKNKYHTDPIYRFKHVLSAFIRGSLDRAGSTKQGKRTEEILGCTAMEFKVYLENQFAPGMSWENRSEWHIDHIIPISWADTEEDAIKLNHYTNLQPLWAEDNLRKSNKIG